MINTQMQRIYTINTLIIINFFNCNASNVVTSMFLYEFLSTFSTYSTNVNCKKAPIPPILIVKNIQNNTVSTVQQLHLSLFSFSARVI